TEIQRRQQRAEQPAGAGPVEGAPEAVARLREPVERGDEGGQRADQGGVRVQGAARRAGGARGIEEQGGVARGRGRRGEAVLLAREQAAPGEGALVGEADADD